MTPPSNPRGTLATLAGFLAIAGPATPAAGSLPREPIAIGREPQYLFDLHVVDNHWALKYADEGIRRVSHQAKKHPGNPVIPTGEHFKISNVWVVRDEPGGVYRMWYQNNLNVAAVGQTEVADPNEVIEEERGRRGGGAFRKYVGYAESKDGIRWEKPHLDFFPDWPGRKLGEPNNCALETGASQAGGASVLIDIPEKDRRGYRHVMLYRRQGGRGAAGIYLVGSHDGRRWDDANQMLIARLASDTHNNIVYDPQNDEYVMFCRSKHIYTDGPGRGKLDSLYCRRVARLTSKTLWTDWDVNPQTILVPDEADYATEYKLYYGMPARYHAGIYWGFLQHFRLNDYIFTELVVSRDGMRFDRMPGRPKLIEYGADGAWDDTMIFTAPWVDGGDRWHLYYVGADGPHNSAEKGMGVGLATIRKEGFISLRGPDGGGMIVTRRILWPGGPLLLNADTRGGEIKVRISDEKRVPIAGFDFDDSEVFRGDSLAHEMKWRGKSLAALQGKVVRLEFAIKAADLFTFRAGK